MEQFKRPFDSKSIDDRENLLNVKKYIFTDLKIEDDLLNDEYLSK